MVVDLMQRVALFAFLALFVACSLHLGPRRVFRLVAGKPPAEAALEALFVVTFPVWIAALAWPGWGITIFEPGWVALPGLVLEVAAVGLFAWALVSFGASWRVGVNRTSPSDFVTGGVFAWSRNPVFLAMDLFAVGGALATGSLFPLLFAIGLLAGLHRQILIEERFLADHHGPAYARFRAAVGRYLGRRHVAEQR